MDAIIWDNEHKDKSLVTVGDKLEEARVTENFEECTHHSTPSTSLPFAWERESSILSHWWFGFSTTYSQTLF